MVGLEGRVRMVRMRRLTFYKIGKCLSHVALISRAAVEEAELGFKTLPMVELSLAANERWICSYTRLQHTIWGSAVRRKHHLSGNS